MKKRDKVIHVRVSEGDKYEAWVAAAEKDERTVSGWIRKICNDAVKQLTKKESKP